MKYRTRRRGASGLPPLLALYASLEPPPKGYTATDEDRELVSDAMFFDSYHFNPRHWIDLPPWQSHPHRDAWRDLAR